MSIICQIRSGSGREKKRAEIELPSTKSRSFASHPSAPRPGALGTPVAQDDEFFLINA
jgi:hypothetical protein